MQINSKKYDNLILPQTGQNRPIPWLLNSTVFLVSEEFFHRALRGNELLREACIPNEDLTSDQEFLFPTFSCSNESRKDFTELWAS